MCDVDVEATFFGDNSFGENSVDVGIVRKLVGVCNVVVGGEPIEDDDFEEVRDFDESDDIGGAESEMSISSWPGCCTSDSSSLERKSDESYESGNGPQFCSSCATGSVCLVRRHVDKTEPLCTFKAN